MCLEQSPQAKGFSATVSLSPACPAYDRHLAQDPVPSRTRLSVGEQLIRLLPESEAPGHTRGLGELLTSSTHKTQARRPFYAQPQSQEKDAVGCGICAQNEAPADDITAHLQACPEGARATCVWRSHGSPCLGSVSPRGMGRGRRGPEVPSNVHRHPVADSGPSGCSFAHSRTHTRHPEWGGACFNSDERRPQSQGGSAK